MNTVKTITADAVVVGSGAAGYNAACRLTEIGKKSVALVTEGVNCGTSRNTGSDKQTYYKLGLGGDTPDCVRQMAENLFAGGAVDGDTALCEAALSSRCFLHLCELGVPFPVDRYGQYVGYKTDHDPFARATSAGPLTSKFMTEALEKHAKRLDVPIYDGLLAVEILKDDDGVCGLLCLEKKSGDFAVFRTAHVVLATGGPAGIYADSVYPGCHTGSSGLALTAGATAQNLTEWQYGLASVAPRWNVSGTYMQVLPRFVSVDADGKEHEFLSDYFDDRYAALSAVFLKGYQWPFDSRKVLEGSSVIDLLVYRECVIYKRRVYLDFTKNPFGLTEMKFEKLSPEAYTYLQSAGARFGTPIERLLHMNTPAVELYRQKGVDIATEKLEIALCAQHHNGGIAVDLWWQTRVPGLFAVGECAGTHGITRPGGSALNAGQVGSLRAAQFISESRRALPETEKFNIIAQSALEKHLAFCEAVLSNENNAAAFLKQTQRRMSDAGAAIRNPERMITAQNEIFSLLQGFSKTIGVADKSHLFVSYTLRDILICQYTCLAAMIDFAKTVGATRGSALYYDKNGELREGLDAAFRFRQEDGSHNGQIQEVAYSENGCTVGWRKVRPLPNEDIFFENVWRRYRENQNIY